jgi:GPH family glycoside/pentoside/hexuronide:cation symporter
MTSDRDLPTPLIWLYALPVVPMGFMFILIGFYLLKYTTDVLLIDPAVMGTLFGLSRIWDAAADPLIGYLSDRTRTRLGRRRPWMLAGALPLCGAFWMLWSAPSGLGGIALTAWMGVALVLFYTAMAVVDVPHAAFGAELSDRYHERTRIFGIKRLLFGFGTLGAVAGVAAFDAAADKRWVAGALALAGAAIGLACVVWPATRLRERPEHQGRGADRPFVAIGDVLRNPHARLLLVVFLIQQLGIVALTGAMPFLTEYVLRTPQHTSLYLAAFFVASLVGIPIWMRIARGRDKKHVLMASMLLAALAIGMLVFAGEGDVTFVLVVAALGGLAAAGGDVIGPSLQADVIDWDELETRQRKEGTYFATWAFAAKSAGGLASMAIGWSLAGMGFVPNAPQSEGAQLGLRVVAALFPAVLYAIGVVLFSRFGLTAAEHARIREQLALRRDGATP